MKICITDPNTLSNAITPGGGYIRQGNLPLSKRSITQCLGDSYKAYQETVWCFLKTLYMLWKRRD